MTLFFSNDRYFAMLSRASTAKLMRLSARFYSNGSCQKQLQCDKIRIYSNVPHLPKFKCIVGTEKVLLNRLFFWTFRKKLKPKKTQNSSKILKKLKQNFEKTQKPATPIELSWC